MQYVQVELDTSVENSEELAAWLTDAALSFEQLDSTTLTPPPLGRVWFRVFVLPEEAEALVQQLTAAFPEAPPVTRLLLRDEDEWRDQWKQFFHARPVGAFVIVPSWERAQVQPQPDTVPLWLDPGRAFGTGGHASTRLCLQLLSEAAKKTTWQNVLDVGCGSGVLAIAALRLWPRARAVAIDLDPEAVEVTLENTEINQVTGRMNVSTGPLAAVSGRFDGILANLTGPVLTELAAALTARLAPEGMLIVSGILSTEVPHIKQAFAAQGLAVQAHQTEEEWSALLLRRA